MNIYSLITYSFVLGLLAVTSACSTTEATLEPGEKVAPPWGVESLCENNPEECNEDQ